MDIFSKKSGDYWATVSIEDDPDGTFSWHLRLALDTDSDRSWLVASMCGFTESTMASTEGMQALSLLDGGHPSENYFAGESGQLRATPLLH
jgi:hypothetical protein